VTEERNWTRKDLPKALDLALEAALEKGGRVPVVLRMTEKSGYTDWVLILSGRSERNVRGIAGGVLDALGKTGREPLATDGANEYLWTLIDYDDFLVHIFLHPVRGYYDLESMWNDAPRVELDLPAEFTDGADLVALDTPEPMPSFRGDMNFGGFEDEFGDEDEFDDEDDGETESVSSPTSPADESDQDTGTSAKEPADLPDTEESLFDED